MEQTSARKEQFWNDQVMEARSELETIREIMKQLALVWNSQAADMIQKEMKHCADQLEEKITAVRKEMSAYTDEGTGETGTWQAGKNQRQEK